MKIDWLAYIIITWAYSGDGQKVEYEKSNSTEQWRVENDNYIRIFNK